MDSSLMEILDFILGFVPFTFFVVFFLFIFGIIRKVPKNTILVIDRKSHYLKTKRRGFYFFNPVTDVITSKVSTMPTYSLYRNVFENHNSTFYEIDFSVTYKAEDAERVIQALADSRRSIDDIVNCAMEVLVTSCDNSEMKNSIDLGKKYRLQVESMIEPFYLDLTDATVFYIQVIPAEIGKYRKFQRHISGSDPSRDSFVDDNPIH